MQAALAMETTDSIYPSNSIPTPAPASTSKLSPLPSTQPQSSTQQPSPGQKRSAHELDTPTSPLSSGQNGSTLNPNVPSISNDDKENRSDSLNFKSGDYTVTMNPAASGAMHTIAGQESVVVPNGEQGQFQTQTGLGAGTSPAAKKRKLTPAEREAKQQEKEAKEKQKLEEKAKKEEEKAKKEEEKRKKDAEKEEERKKREEKKKAKDEEKAAKEEEKRKKDEEKLKKERAQTKLNSFFTKPKSIVEMPSSSSNSSPKKPSGDDVSTDSERVSDVSAYQREFPDFFLHPNTYIAPQHRFERDAQALAHLRAEIDSSFNTGSAQQIAFRPSEIFRMMPYKRPHGYQSMSVKDILLQMQSLSDIPKSSEAARKLQSSLRQVRMKSLKFGEDVRPPYQGTYTKHLSSQTTSKLMRNPFARALPEVNYDYDSEAEWEDAEEGEDLDSEDEEEGSEDGDEDMDGFLDDEDDHLANGNKRRLLVGDLEPVCSGIKWQDQGCDPELQTYKLETILPAVTFPIDPFSSVYWQQPTAADQAKASGRLGRSAWHTFMGNPAPGSRVTQEASTGTVVKRAFPVEQLGEFKTVVQDSNLTKTGLVEVLKKRFPKVSKGTLKQTLDSVATRVGQKEADKKWVCN